MSIVRIGLAETRHFAEGYDAIFGKKRPEGKKLRASGKKAKVSKRKKARKK